MSQVKERVVLPGSYELRPHQKNFLAENVKKLRNLQKQVQKKTAQAQPEKRRSRVLKESHSGSDVSPSMKSRVSTPITVLQSAKPLKNQRVQTFSGAAVKSGRIVKISAAPKDKMEDVEPVVCVTKFQDTSGGGDDPSDQETDDDKLELLRKIVSKENKNFVETNTFKLYKKKPEKSKPDRSKIPPNYKRGEVPRYLQTVKRERLNSESNEYLDPDCPSGFVKLSEQDRLAHLAQLKSTQNELIRKQNSLSLRMDTLMMKQRKADLDRELTKIEEAMRLFSREKLFVKVGS